MPAEHEFPDRQDQSLDPQQQRMDEADGIDGVQAKAAKCANVL